MLRQQFISRLQGKQVSYTKARYLLGKDSKPFKRESEHFVFSSMGKVKISTLRLDGITIITSGALRQYKIKVCPISR